MNRNSTFSIKFKNKSFLVDQPVAMGILNITTDSFYEGSRTPTLPDIEKKAIEMVENGASILDIGGQSTRPGATLISPQQEIDRVVPAIEHISNILPDVVLSIDTVNSLVAHHALMAGAHWVNDVSGGQLDPNMLATVGQHQAPYILTHMRGTPANMQQQTHYEEDLLTHLLRYFSEKIATLNQLGCYDIIIDPGVGFAKTKRQNFHLIKHLSRLLLLEKPLLMGVSRKSLIYKSLNISPNEALNGTTALHMAILMQGAHILRTHDVKEAVECIKIFKEITDSEG